jgi:putative iron-regulated protein
MLNDPEEEHDCFSDNTHNSHFYDGVGIRNVYLGTYTRTDGSVLQGPSLSELVAAANPAVDSKLTSELDASVAALQAMKAAGDAGKTFDTLIAPGNAEGEALVMGAVNALVTQTASIDRAVTTLGLSKITFEGSDSLDSPDAVFQ